MAAATPTAVKALASVDNAYRRRARVQFWGFAIQVLTVVERLSVRRLGRTIIICCPTSMRIILLAHTRTFPSPHRFRRNVKGGSQSRVPRANASSNYTSTTGSQSGSYTSSSSCSTCDDDTKDGRYRGNKRNYCRGCRQVSDRSLSTSYSTIPTRH